MTINEWVVIESAEDKTRHYLYGSLDEYEEDELVEGEKIPFHEWNSEDVIEIMGNALEDANKHRLSRWLPRTLYNTCKAIKMSDRMTEKYMREVLLRFEKGGMW